jgi:hypothetical protein
LGQWFDRGSTLGDRVGWGRLTGQGQPCR